MEATNCKKCNEPINGNYCSNCGHPAQLTRINGRYVLKEMADAFNAQKGFLYTLKKLIVNPGDHIRVYITEDRSRFMKPISFVIITSLIYTCANYFFPISNFLPTSKYDSEINQAIFEWTQQNSGYVNLIAGFFMAFGVRIIFRKAGYTLFEIFIVLCYVFGFTSILDAVALIFQSQTNVNLMIPYVGIIETAYIAFATGQFFDKKKVSTYIKVLLSFGLGMLIVSLLSWLIGFIYVFLPTIIHRFFGYENF